MLYPETFARRWASATPSPTRRALRSNVCELARRAGRAGGGRAARFGAALGEALLAGALKPANRGGAANELPRALEDMEGVLQRLRDGGVIASFELTGEQRDRVAEEWEGAPPSAGVG